MIEPVENKTDDRMKIWNYAFKTDPSTTKEVGYGSYKYTTVCAYSQILKATKMWGSFGCKWGVMDESFTLIGAKTMLYQATLFYPAENKNCFVPIHSDDLIVKWSDKKQKDVYNDDWSKKLATDALTKGLSKLGFNADIFTGKFEQQKYHDAQ